MSDNRIFYALTGNLEWIRDYLKSSCLSFEFDHIMGEGFYRVFMTLEEYTAMENEAEKLGVELDYLGISDICNQLKAVRAKFDKHSAN